MEISTNTSDYHNASQTPTVALEPATTSQRRRRGQQRRRRRRRRRRGITPAASKAHTSNPSSHYYNWVGGVLYAAVERTQAGERDSSTPCWRMKREIELCRTGRTRDREGTECRRARWKQTDVGREQIILFFFYQYNFIQHIENIVKNSST